MQSLVPTNADDIELKATLEQLSLDLVSDAVKTDMASREDGLLGGHAHGGHGGWYRWSSLKRGGRGMLLFTQ